MEALALIRLLSLLDKSKGSPNVSIGIIDGPIDFSHPSFSKSNIETVRDSDIVECKRADSLSCVHGTFVTGMLAATRDSTAPAISPECRIILRPVFRETASNLSPSSTPEELSVAIVEIVNAGARIINLSLGLSGPSMVKIEELQRVYNYAFKKNVIIVTAAGNQGNIGYSPISDHPLIIPVVSCDGQGRPDPTSNTSPSIARRGIMSPGVNITSTVPGGGYRQLSGTSFAAPFVTGTIALLLSLYKNASSTQIIRCIREIMSVQRRRTIIPPLLDAEKSEELLRSIISTR